MHDDRGYEDVHSAGVASGRSDRRSARARLRRRAASLRRGGIAASPLVVRTLVHALTRALTAGEPDVIVHWARMVREAHPRHVVVAMVEAACAAAEEIAHADGGDVVLAMIFLEVVKSRTSSHVLHDAPGVAGEPAADSAIESLLAMLRARDEATCTHSHATGALSRRIAVRMGLSADVTERVTKGGVLHDIGKMLVPDAILLKPGPLDEREWVIMKRHAEAGADILMDIPALAQYAPIVRAHHERWDGRGYPDGLAGEEIMLEARIVAVADSFHAMTTERVYREPLTRSDAIAVIADGRGKQWDPQVADVLIALAAHDRTMSADASLPNMRATNQTTIVRRLQGLG